MFSLNKNVSTQIVYLKDDILLKGNILPSRKYPLDFLIFESYDLVYLYWKVGVQNIITDFVTDDG